MNEMRDLAGFRICRVVLFLRRTDWPDACGPLNPKRVRKDRASSAFKRASSDGLVYGTPIRAFFTYLLFKRGSVPAQPVFYRTEVLFDVAHVLKDA